MGCRQRRSPRGQQVAHAPAAALRRTGFECRTPRRGWCGILLLAATFSAACGQSERASPPPEEITIAFPEGTGVRADRGAGQVAASLSNEGLTLVGPDGRVAARLANGWRWVNDRELRVTIRPEIVLHNDQKLDAPLAARILKRFIADKDRRRSFPSFTDITEVKAESATELVFSLARHSYFLPEDLSTPLTLGTGTEPRYGTGPYRTISNDESTVTLERFDKYHGGRPGVARVSVATASTLRTAWASLLRGDIDMVADLPPDTVELIRNENVRIIPYRRPYQYIIGLNLRLQKFADPRVRLALNMAIDRNAIVSSVLQGAGVPSSGPIWYRHWAVEKSVAFPFAPRRAEALLQAAGLPIRSSADPKLPPSRLRITCLVPEGFIVYEHLALELQRQLSEVGVDLRFDVQSFDTYDDRLTAGEFEAVMIDIVSGPGLSRSSIFWRSPTRREVLSSFGYHNSETEALFEELRAADSDAVVQSITRRLQDAFQRNPPAIFLAWNERARTVRGDFRIDVQEGVDPLPRLWQWGAQVAESTNGR